MVDTLARLLCSIEDAKEKTRQRGYGLSCFKPGNAIRPQFAGAIEAQIEQAIGLLSASQNSIQTVLFLKRASDETDK